MPSTSSENRRARSRTSRTPSGARSASGSSQTSFAGESDPFQTSHASRVPAHRSSTRPRPRRKSDSPWVNANDASQGKPRWRAGTSVRSPADEKAGNGLTRPEERHRPPRRLNGGVGRGHSRCCRAVLALAGLSGRFAYIVPTQPQLPISLNPCKLLILLEPASGLEPLTC